MHRRWVHAWFLFPLIALLLAGCASGGSGAPQATCGNWAAAVSANDPRLATESLASPTTSDCRGDFRITSNTKALGILGGYTLEMTVEHMTNVKSQIWTGLPGNHPNQVLPARVSEFHVIPQDSTANAEIALMGAITRDSLTTDASLFLIRTALALLSLPVGCVIPPDLIFAAAIDHSNLLQKTGDRLLGRDVPGAIDELRHSNDPFFSQVIESLKAQAPQCAVTLVENLVGTVTGIRGIVFVTKTAVNFAAWAGAVAEDEVKYQGQPVRISLAYTPAGAKAR